MKNHTFEEVAKLLEIKETELSYELKNESKKTLDDFNNLIKESSSLQNELNKRLSELDLEKSDILHYIELEKFNAVKGNKVLNRLREVLEQRRNVKNELTKIQQVHSRVSTYKVVLNKKLVNIEEKKFYVYKTDILADMGIVKESQSSKEI